MTSSNVCSSFSLQTYSTQERGGFVRGLGSLNIQKRGFVAPLKVAPSQTHCLRTRCNDKLHSKRPLQISSALANNHENIENLPVEKSISNGVFKYVDAFYRFTRPYVIIGTVIGVASVSLLPIETITDLSPALFKGILKAMIPAVLMNIYVAGVNQVYDIEIDKINKPDLPLASGDLSLAAGVGICAGVTLLSLALAYMTQSPPLILFMILDFLIGSAYSVDLPFLRWKKNTFLAVFSIAFRRAIILPLACFAHVQKYVLGRPIVLSRSLVFAMGFVSLILTVITLFKDIPDVEGDKDHGINSLTLRLGQHKVYWLCMNSLFMGYGAAIAIGLSSPFMLSKIVTVLGHGTLALLVWLRARSTDPTDRPAVWSFYLFMWELLYAEYLLIPFVR